jgi:serine/threonine protein kinase
MAVRTNLLPPRYQGVRRIGRGGMGEVFRATDDQLGRVVAVKILAERHAGDEAVRGRFLREALAAARLSGHPHTVTIYDVGEWEGQPFIVMEHLAGGTLADALTDGPPPPGQALEWLGQVARALDDAHEQGVVHRDVKPANLLLDESGAVHVGDFGIASAVGMDSLTQTGTVLGTAGYLSPEQAQGVRASPASDRYALGVVAFELLTGRRPFESDNATAEAAAHVHAPVPSARSVEPSLPPAADAVLERALAKEPDMRYSTCRELVDDLRRALTTEESTTRLLPVPQPARARRSLLPLGFLLLALAALGGGLAAWALTGDSERERATPSVVVRTVTAPGQTLQRTVTQPVTATPPPPPPVDSAGDAHELNDRGYALMNQGDYAGALPLLQQAVDKLRGAGPEDRYEAWSLYNLAYTLLQLGRCGEALPLLDRSEALQGKRKEIDRARRAARKCDSRS